MFSIDTKNRKRTWFC